MNERLNEQTHERTGGFLRRPDRADLLAYLSGKLHIPPASHATCGPGNCGHGACGISSCGAGIDPDWHTRRC